MAITVRLFAKKDFVSRDGTVPIYLRLTIHRKVYPFRLQYRVPPQHWDDYRREVMRTHPHATKLNRLLGRELARAQEILLDHDLTGRPIGMESFKKEFSGLTPYNFYDLSEDYVRGQRGTDSPAYLEKVGHVVNKLKQFAPKLDLHDITYDFLIRYRQHLVVDRGNGKNTIHSNFRILRRIVKDGIRRKLIKENPFDSLPLERVRSKRESLSFQEFQKYEQLLSVQLPFYLHKTLCWFVLAVYTGRRYQDLEHFSSWEFTADQVRIVQHKRIRGRDELKTVALFLNERIRRIVALIREKDYKPINNRDANKFLKEVNARAGITRNITFHSARHTFANINKKLTADLSVRRDLLGHDSVKSTLIYDHVDEDLLKIAMLKWDNLN